MPLVPGANVMHIWLGPWVGGGHAPEAALGQGAETATHAEGATHAAGHSVGLEVALMAFSVALALIGIWTAWQFYVKQPARAQDLGRRFAAPYRLLWNKYYVDEVYNAVVVQPLVGGSRFLWRVFDVGFIDGMVNGSGRMMRGFAGFLRPIQNGLAGSYAAAIMLGAILIMGYVLTGGWR